MTSDWLKTRQTRFTAYATVYILIVIGVLGLANFLANRYNKSYDATSNKKYSLSDQTEKVVKGLKQDVSFLFFDSNDRFPAAKDLLDRYNTLSTHVKVQYIDPLKKPQLAAQYGVRNNPGVTIVEVAGKREEAKSVSEEDLTGALIRVLKGGDRTVCFVTGSGEHSIDDTSGRQGYGAVKDLIAKNNYKTRAVSLIEKPEVPKDCTILAAGGPHFDYVKPAVDAIKAYVEGGGKAMLLLDPPLKLGREEYSDNAELLNVLAGWGVTLEKNLVLDTSGVGQIFGLSEVVPLVTAYESHPIVRDMKEVATAFPLARSLDAKSAGNASSEKLFSTSGNAYATTNLGNAQISINPDKDKKGPFALGAAGTYGKNGRFVVVGSSGWISNGILRFNGNRDLVLNMLNWLSSDEDLISIRPKEPADRRLSMSVRQMRTLSTFAYLILPLAVVAAGISVWWKRR